MAIQLNLKKSMFLPKFYPLLLDYSHRWEFYMGSAGSGKSRFIHQKLLIRACREDGIRILICRKTAESSRETTFEEFKGLLIAWKLLPYVNINKTDKTITFSNGSKIIFMGLDTETRLLSLANISCIFIEEAFEVEKNFIEQLNLRMRGNQPNQQILMAWNPISKHSYLYDFTVTNPPANSIFIHSTYKDNHFLNQEYINALEELYTRNPQKARIYCDGEWGVDEDGLIYKRWKEQYFNHEEINGAFLCGVDFGFIHDLSTIVCALLVEEEGRIYVFDEYGSTGKTNKDLANIIKDKGLSKSVIIADCAEPKSIAEIKAEGILKIKPCSKGKDSLLHSIQKLQNYEIIIHPKCTGIIEEISNYTWEKDKVTGYYTNKPDSACAEHYLDALRYSLQCVGSKLKSFDKNLL